MSRLVLAALSLTVFSAGASAQAAPTDVKVMTRNVYLGADLGPGVRASSLPELVNAAGTILNEVDANRFPTRAKGLAAEILKNRPDLVGLQEAALWRTQPCSKNPLPPSATTVRYDSIKLLLAQLNKGAKRYRLVVAKPEFDFEIWANTDGNAATAGPGCPAGSEINGRLTMRDAILVRLGAGVSTSKAKSGTFKTLLQVRPAGVPVDVTRGWTSVDARKGGKRFRFVNSHFEAFDSAASNNTNTGKPVGNGQIREAQTKELVSAGHPATAGKLPVIALGDFNSDVRSEVKPGDGLAYRALRKAGFAERAKARPFACCLETSLLKRSGSGRASDFDHTVDHVMTDAPKRVTLVSSTVTGLKPVNGFWNSDHAGVFSRLRLR